MNKNECWVVICAFNEHKHIEDVVQRVKKQGFKAIVVDDGSRDKTEELAKKAGASVLRHVVNLGKGAAMKTGAEYAFHDGANAVIFLDGDGQHNPEELGLFLKELNAGHDIVFGARKMRKNMPAERKLGNWTLRKMVKMIYNINIHDPLSGYRAITKKAYGKIKWKSRDYAVETEMIARAGKEVLSYGEVDIKTIYHDRYKGMTILDGLKIVFKLVWWRMTH